MAAPLYSIGQTVYLRESAAIGFLEAIIVFRVGSETDGTWVYSASFAGKQPTLPLFGELVSHSNGRVILYNETELVLKSEAVELAIESVETLLAKLVAMRG